MFTLRCTQKLMRRLPMASTGADPEPTTLLGDWYATVVYLRPQHLVLSISERTLLPVIVAAKGAPFLVERLVAQCSEILVALDVPVAAMKQEIGAMASVDFGSTKNRRVLGSLNELVFLLKYQMQFRPGLTLFEHAIRLAETPMSFIRSSPDRATRGLFRTTPLPGPTR